MKTKKPSAIVYGWYKEGIEILDSDVYFEEGLFEKVEVISLPEGDVFEDYSLYRPDLIISINKEVEIPNYQLEQIYIHRV